MWLFPRGSAADDQMGAAWGEEDSSERVWLELFGSEIDDGVDIDHVVCKGLAGRCGMQLLGLIGVLALRGPNIMLLKPDKSGDHVFRLKHDFEGRAREHRGPSTVLALPFTLPWAACAWPTVEMIYIRAG